jgi:aerobic-type carbon monoxide dehydrogenase small subunit (CoxS/CutS family)
VRQFRLPHNVALSKDGFVYVADRINDRIQVFRRDGTFVREGFIAPRTLLAGSASGLAFSPDQRFLYVIDGANHHVWILLRETLQVVDHIGQQGIFGGSLNVPHATGTCTSVKTSMAGASNEFVYKGMGAPTGQTPVLWVIRDTIGLTGTKFGRGGGLCGACTVHVNGRPVRSCVTPASQVVGREIITIEGLSPNAEHPAQIAGREGDVPACGYCQSGQIMAVAALLAKKPNPTRRRHRS